MCDAKTWFVVVKRQMNPIVIADETTWPTAIKSYIKDLKIRCSRYEDVGVSESELFSEMCASFDYIVYHYTKEGEHAKFRETGLRCLNLDAHVQEFLDVYGSRFAVEEIDRLKRVLYGEANRRHQPEGRIYFTVPRRLSPEDFGICDLVGYFGGEAIYWMFKKHVGMSPIDRAISEKLRCIGRGCEVSFVAPTKWIAHGWISDSLLKRAYGENFAIDGSVNHDIPPGCIAEVRYFDNAFLKTGSRR